MTPPNTPDTASVDSAFVDAVMERVRQACPADANEELFPGRTSAASATCGASTPHTASAARVWLDRLTRLAFVVAAAICLVVRVSLLGSMLAGEPIDEAPSTVSRSPSEVVDDV